MTKTDPDLRTAWMSGLWHANPALVTLLGLCPLLALSNTTVNALGLGLATLVALVITNVSVSLLRDLVPPAVRLPVHVLIIATSVTVIELSMQAWFTELHAVLGIFLPLIVTNCLILGRAQVFACRHGVRASLHDAVANGAGFLIVLVILGSCRELLGQGTILANAELLFGEAAATLATRVFAPEQGLLLALLPPGAFIALGLLLAARNACLAYRSSSVGALPNQAEP